VRSLSARGAGVRLAVRRAGRSGPALVLIHGLASTQHIWDLIVPRLERRFRVITFDQRGHGESSKPGRGYGFDDVTADLGGVLRAVRVTRPILVGHSYGANVSIDFAARHPKAVAGVVSVDGGMGSISEIMDWKGARQLLAPPKLNGVHIDEIMAMARNDVGSRWSPELEPIVRSLFEIDARGRIKPRLARSNHFRILRAMYDQRPKELLARMEVPTLMYCARPRKHVMESERAFYEMKRDSVKRIRRANPRIQVEWITSIHDIPVDRPRELAERIARFAAEANQR
jgi:pimeloyl-ACP methyl ester carboxylesterase